MRNREPIPWTTADILAATGGELICGDQQQRFSRVSIDSREISAKDLFVAIIGDTHDGHLFASNVVELGVRGVVINRINAEHLPVAAWQSNHVACITVDDTTRALGDLATFNRQRCKALVVAITGSNGKTTTRRLTTAVLARQYNIMATAGNFNNDIGLPLTLLGLEADHQWAVLEMGTNNPGEIARLTQICSPNIGVITNIGPAHLEGLGSLDGVMREKGDILKGLRSGGKAVLNADDPRVMQLALETKNEVLFFGLSPNAAIRAEDIKEKDQKNYFTLIYAEEKVPIKFNVSGRFMILNALAAAAVGSLLGLSSAAVKAGLEAFEPEAGRMNILHLPNGVNVIDDTYNANPDSMNAALTTLKNIGTTGRRIFVAGDMLELGPEAQSLHNQVGATAARTGINRLYASGDFDAVVVAGAHDEGMQRADTMTGSHDEIVEDLKSWLRPGDWVLVKGSRGMTMEKVVQGLKAWGEKSETKNE